MLISNDFFNSSLLAISVQLIFYINTYILDKYINSELSNLIGLIIDLILDYIAQQYIFMKKIYLNFTIISKYLSTEFVFIIVNQILFSIYNRKIYKKTYKKSYNIIARIIINIIMYILLVFPTRKYFVFIK